MPPVFHFLPIRSKTVRTSALHLCAVLVLGCATWAQSTEVATVNPVTHTLTITIKGTLGPVLEGSDPLGGNGQSGTVAIMVSESLSPVKHTVNSATYSIPAGAITVTVGSNKFKSQNPSNMIVRLTNSADTLTLITSVTVSGINVTITDTTFLKAGSWTRAVLKHPTVFKPTPQKVTSAVNANGPGCKLKYVVFGGTTVLGFNGTASNSATVDPVLPDEDVEQ